MPGYRDWDMLNQAITGLGDAAARRRQQNVVNQREAERIALEHEMRGIQQRREDRIEKEGNRQFDLMVDREDRMRDTATKPTYRWTSGGVEQTAHSLKDFGQMIQAHPADPTDDDHSELDLSGVNAHGVTVRQKIRIPNSLKDHDGAKQSAAEAIKSFAEYTGSVSVPEPEVFTTPGGQEFVKRGKQLIKGAPAPDPGSTTTTIKTEPPPAWAAPGTAATSVTNTTTRVPNQPAKSGREAQGGYKIGTRYKGGLIYLGGDPNNQNSWSRAE